MTSTLLIAFGLILAWFAIKTREQITAITLAFVSSAIWLACIVYTRANPIGSMVTGDGADNAVLTAFIAMMILVPVITWRVNSREKKKEVEEANNKKIKSSSFRSLRSSSSTKGYRETEEEYYDRLRELTRR